MIIHCIATNLEFFCYRELKRCNSKKIELKNKKIKFSSFEVDPISAKNFFDDDVKKCREFYKKEFNLN